MCETIAAPFCELSPLLFLPFKQDSVYVLIVSVWNGPLFLDSTPSSLFDCQRVCTDPGAVKLVKSADSALVAPLSTAAWRLNAWKQDNSGGFSNRIASKCSLPVIISRVSGKRPSDLPSIDSSSSVTSQNGSDESTEDNVGSMASLSAVPTLSNGSTSSSFGSIDTRMAAGIEVMNVLEEDETGVLVAPSSSRPQCIYHCLFHILRCDERFDSAEEWKTHVLSHFRTHPPPTSARCPMCQERFFDDRQGQAWDDMLEHVAQHYQRGHTLALSRPDFELMQYLYRWKIISDEQFKAIQLPPPPSSPAYHRSQDSVRASIGSSDEPYCAVYSRRREQRVRGQRRGISVA